MLPSSRPRYGYQWTNDDRAALAVDPVTAPNVRRIFASMAAGESLRSIAHALHTAGIPTPSGRGQWRPTTIREMIRNPLYKGEAYAWCWREKPGTQTYTFDHENAIRLPDGTAPALVSAETWDAAQERMARNVHMRPALKYPEAALLRNGYARCGYCGRPVHVVNNGGKLIYRCASQSDHESDCPSWTMKVDKLDGLVWERAIAKL